MVKIARRHCVWDVASVAARMCLCYDEKGTYVFRCDQNVNDSVFVYIIPNII